jgi:hypothetical protein
MGRSCSTVPNVSIRDAKSMLSKLQDAAQILGEAASTRRLNEIKIGSFSSTMTRFPGV